MISLENTSTLIYLSICFMIHLSDSDTKTLIFSVLTNLNN